ncbi:ATP-binding protein [Streptomyces sp. NBC_00289]|uniref:ATP-binding protein n=1 Tax=Streptomyces sp. NBC_00289 TaxID=2975703 RepID=UPI003246425E
MSAPVDHTHRPLGRTVSGAGGAAWTDGSARPPRPAAPGEQPFAKPPWASGTVQPVALRIACSGEGFARARAFTHETLHRWSLGHRSDDAALVITELAANAVEHGVPRAPRADPEVWLRLVLDPAHVLLAVSDPGDNPLPCHPVDDLQLRENGRGLCIVDALAEEWGWTPDPPAGKTVWARLSTLPPP